MSSLSHQPMADTSTHPQPQPYPQWIHHPPPPPPPHYRSTSPFLRAFAAGIVLILIIAVVVYTVEYLIFGPLLPDFQVVSLQLLNFSAAAPSLSALWIVGFSVNNPNKKLAISLDNIESSIYYKDKILSQARIHRFAVPRRNSTAVVTPFVADSAADMSVLNDINGDFARGAINFTVAVLGHVAFETGVWRWRGTFFRAFCSDGRRNLTAVELVGGSRQCKVR